MKNGRFWSEIRTVIRPLGRFMNRLLARVLTWLFRGLGLVLYKDAKEGEMHGSVVLLWVDESETYSGAGRFVYVPFPGDELRFSFTSSAHVLYQLKPAPFYTDGGSIPRPAQIFKGFSPWDYAPAYILHDWVFVAKRCLAEKPDCPMVQQIKQMTFRESAELMGAALRTLARTQVVYENNVAKTTITGVVSMGFSRRLWNDGQSCDSQQLSEADARKVRAFIDRNTPTVEALPTSKASLLSPGPQSPSPLSRSAMALRPRMLSPRERTALEVPGIQVMGLVHSPEKQADETQAQSTAIP